MTTAVITGAGSGIGRSFALALAAPGVALALADIDLDGAAATAERARRRGARAIVADCDVARADAVETLAERVDRELGPVELLINNAGVLVTGSVVELPLADYRRAIDVNLWGVIHGCRAFAPAMQRRGRGRIINVASLAGFVPLPLMGPYSATKAAVIALSESLRGELAESGVTVTVLCPSFTRTELINASTGNGSSTALSRARAIMHAAGATPEEVVACALAASERGELYAIPTRHGKLAWRAKRLLPGPMTRAVGALQRFAR